MNALEVKNLSFSYDGKTPTLSEVSFCLAEGSYTCLIGHNGSGKSSLAKIIMGLVNDYQGEIVGFGEVVNKDNIVSFRNKVGIVFQNPDNQFVASTVADDIAFGLENHQVPQVEMDGIISHYAKICGMEEFLNREPESLSGGQKQRVAIAGVLAMHPALVIFDEATSMLDPKGKKEILSIIESLKKSNDKLTVLSITHDVEEASRADQVLVLDKGRIIVQGKPNEVFAKREILLKAKLDTPFLTQVKEEMIQQGFKLDEDIDSLEKLEDYLCQ